MVVIQFNDYLCQNNLIMERIDYELNSHYKAVETIHEDYESDRYIELKRSWDILEDSIQGLIAWYEKVKYIKGSEIKVEFEKDKAYYIKEQKEIELLMQEEKDNY